MKISYKEDRISRLGEIKNNTYNTPMKIIRYRISGDITIEFQDKYKIQVNTTYNNFNRGCINNPYDRTIYGIGYVGVGRHPTHLDKKNTDAYGTWKNMIQRCYYEKTRNDHPAYADCTVCEEWLNFQKFADWYEENYYHIGTGRMHIDKDIIVKGNKEYAPDKCIFVPQRINMVFMRQNRKVDSDLPQGIRRCVGGYMVSYNAKYLGVHRELDKAIEVYSIKKREHIRQLAEEYKHLIPQKVYKALLEW